MTDARLFLVAAVVTLLAWLAAAAEAFVVLLVILSGWCSESSTEAECNAKQSGSEAMLLFLSAIVVAVALGVLFLAIRRLARPKFRRQWWYVAAAAGMLIMPVAVIATGLAVFDATSHPGGDATLAWISAVVVQLAWPFLWTLGFRHIAEREHRLHPLTDPLRPADKPSQE